MYCLHFMRVTPKLLIEAMANGCVAIASKINNHQELIENGINGHLFDLSGNDLSLKIKANYRKF